MTEEELYDRTLTYLRDHLDAPCECMPNALLRYLCRETARAPRITAKTEEMPGPELFDYAIRHYYRQRKKVMLKVVPVEEYARQFYACGQSGKVRPECSVFYDPQHPTAYMLDYDYQSRYIIWRDYLRAVRRSRNFFRRTVRGMALFDFERYPDMSAFLVHTAMTLSGCPFYRYRGKYYMNIDEIPKRYE